MATQTDPPQDRRIGSSKTEAPDNRLCPHLAPVLRHLLTQGCAITGSASMVWSRIDLEVTLDRGPAPANLPPGLLAGNGVSIWSNADPHYPIAHGLLCASCRHSLGWPC